jgi:hypothetical protein
MSISVIDKPSDTTDCNVDTVTEFFHHLTAERFLRLGVPLVVYFRACMVEGDLAYALHNADGTLIAVVKDIDTAVARASERGMAVVAVH